MVEFDNNEGLTEAEIRRIEFRIKRKIPEAYREFLKKHNGGRPSPDSFKIPEPGNPNQGSTMSAFFGVRDRKKNYDDIVWNYEILKDRIPSDTLPIGEDCGGNIILIGTGPLNYGKIYFWDHELEADTDIGEVPDYSNVTLLADDFQSFLDSLYHYRLDDDGDGES